MREAYATTPVEVETVTKVLTESGTAFQEMDLDQFRKIIDLLEHPPESGLMREVLDKYDGPRDYERIRSEIDFYESSQDPQEFAAMLEIIRGSKSLLEVGSRFGGTLVRMACVLQPNSHVTSVDYPMCDGTSHVFNPLGCLRKSVAKIEKMGHTVELILCDSKDPDAIDRARLRGPYDFGFIDADHSYNGVKSDWENYGPMCKIVGFHDIINPPSDGCRRLWAELKPHYPHEEFTFSHGKHELGIGIIYRDRIA